MSSIWNPQDRFILSNMTSEKLYAKSPLTTGVSGTSAYIGLEPSATYNETVLFENDLANNSAISAFTLTEKLSNFERVRFQGYVNGGYFVSELPNYSIIDSTVRFGTVAYSPDNYGSPLEIYGVSYSSTNGTSFTGIRTTLRWCNQTITSALQGTTAATWPVIGKIVGINHK